MKQITIHYFKLLHSAYIKHMLHKINVFNYFNDILILAIVDPIPLMAIQSCSTFNFHT